MPFPPHSVSVRDLPAQRSELTVALAVTLFFAAAAHASSISGTVVDPQGRPVPEARVTLLSPLRAVQQRAATADGRYRFDGLDGGIYTVVAQTTGLSATDTKVQLGEHQDRTVDVRLKLSALQQQVVVSASLGGALTPQVGSSVSVLTQSEMDARGNQTIYDALRAVPGVTVSQSGRWGGVASVFVRGGESDYNLVLMDGIPLNQFGGAFDFAPLTSDGVERVEVTRSPESALYGSDAVSSVVDIITQQGDGPSHFNLLEEVGNFSTYRLAVGASGLTHGLGWSVHASRLYSGGVVANDQYTDQSALVSLTYPSGGRRQLSFHFFGNANNAGDPGPYGSDPDHLFTGIDYVSRDKQNLFGYALSYADQFTSRFRQVTTATVAVNNYDFLSPSGDDFTHNLGAVFNTRSELLISNQDFLVGGFEFNREQVEDTYIADASNVPFLLRRNTYAHFLENRWIPTSRWSITTGARVDDIRTGSLPPDIDAGRPAISANSIVQVNPHVSAAWLAHPAAPSSNVLGATRLHTSFGTGIRAPSGFELAFTDNPALRPERSLSFDAGVEQRMLRDRAVFDLTYFYNRFKDQIEVLGGSLTNLSTFTSANLGNSRAEGLEASFHMRPSPAWSFEGSYSFVPTSILALDGTSEALAPFQVGQPLLRRPKNFGFYALSWSRKRFILETAGYLRGHDLDLEPNYGTYACELGLQCLFENKGYARIDGGFSYRAYRSLELYGRLYNLLDKHYEEVLGYPALPLNFVAGLRFTFPAE